MRLALLAALALSLAAAPTALAQQRLTLEAIHASSEFNPAGFQGGRWAESGPVVTYVEAREDGTTDLMSYNLETDARAVLIDGSNLIAPDTGRPIQIEDYAYGPDGARVLLYTDSERVWRLNTKGFYYVLDTASGEVTALSDRSAGFQMFAKLSPDGRHAAFVRERDLFLVDLQTGQETALTTSGSPGGIINGTSDWVYEEEFGLRDGWRFSPDGRFVAFVQLDETNVRDFAMTDLRGLYPEYERFRYPKAGETNSEIRVGVIDVSQARAEPRFFDTDTWNEGGEETEYIPLMGWTPGGDVWMFRLNRDQNVLDVLYGDPQSMAVQTVLREQSDTWLDVETGFSDLDVGALTYLQNGEQMIWISDRDDYRHLYLYDNDGTPLGRLTEGDWDVTDFLGADEAAGLIYYVSTAEGSTERHVYRQRVDLAAGRTLSAPERLTDGDGWSTADLSRDRRYFIHTVSDLDTPTVVTLRRSDGSPIKTLQDNAELAGRLSDYALGTAELTSVPGADGTGLNTLLIKPSDFDPAREYPVLMYVYGGPGSQAVRNAWLGSRYLWHQYLAQELGVVVAIVDNRGTGGRGRAFKNAVYKRLGELEAQDQIAAAQHLAAQPWADEDRIGIWGWSYGGFMSLMAMTYGDGPETFRMGMSVAPVTDWRLYDTIYTERYMSTPQRNPAGYALSPIGLAPNLDEDADLLIVHGDFDDNVHFQNAIQMADALQAAGKQFDLMVYPGRNHGIHGGTTRLHLFTLLTDYVREHLAQPMLP
jgi:dipeptidyl-peptidase-4